MMRIFFKLLILTSFLSTSCLKRSGDSSSLKFGYTEQITNDGFLNLLPEKTVSICRQYPSNQRVIDNVKNALTEWLNALGRAQYINIRESCDISEGGALIDVGIVSPLPGCVSGTIACTNFRGNGYFSINFASLEFAQNYSTALHETGHLWGNCDRYGAYDFSVPVRGSNCDGRNNGQFNAASVMQATTPRSPQHLTADDLAGIQEVAQDDNLGANAVWKRFLAAKNSSSGLSNPAKPEQAAPQAPMQEVSCPDLYVYNSTSKMCDWNLGCPAKYIYNKNTRMCDWNRFCPAGYVLNPQTRMCDWYLVCPIGYLYNPQTRMCDLGM